jgi:Ca2+/Na+ antiporter
MTIGNVLARIIPIGIVVLGIMSIVKGEKLRKSNRLGLAVLFYLAAFIALTIVAIFIYLIYDFDRSFKVGS